MLAYKDARVEFGLDHTHLGLSGSWLIVLNPIMNTKKTRV